MKAFDAMTGAFCMKSRRASFSENRVFLLFGPKRLENCPFDLPFGEPGIEFDEESEKHGLGGQKRTKSVRFDSIRFGSVRFPVAHEARNAAAQARNSSQTGVC